MAGPRTIAVHGGERPDPATGASSPSIVLSSTFVTEGPEAFSAYDLSADTPYLYTRWSNPTVDALAAKLALLEGAEAGQCFASGMAATAAIFTTFLKAGDHAVVSDVCYAAIAELARDYLPRFGIAVTCVDASDAAAVRAAVTDRTKLIFVDTPCNPLLRLSDIAALGTIAKEAGALLAVDSTFATPIATRPLALGADLVMHSATKYLCGHGDAIGGVVVGAADLVAKLRADAAIHFGGVMSPFNAWLIARGVATLPLRMKSHEENALAVARFLESHPAVERVTYPGLPSHPQHDLARRQMSNFSGMIAFQVKGGAAAGRTTAHRMAQNLGVIHYAVSLGHHRSLICWMQTDELLASSFGGSPGSEAAYRAWAGDGLFRLSIGLEEAEDLIRDLDACL